MRAYYNEHDRRAAEWLRELIRAGLIPAGDVDERSIVDVRPHELTGYTQQHFFAGIGGWAYALRLAGWPDDRPVRTGSCPCQPFSCAGKGLGEADERHLWPIFRDLITFGEATTTFGEQVASKAGRAWLAGIRADLEGLGYAVGAADLCAAGVGAPHIRQRLFWVAHVPRVGRRQGSAIERRCGSGANPPAVRLGSADNGNAAHGLADSEYTERRPQHVAGEDERDRKDAGRSQAHCLAGTRGEVCGMGDANGAGSFTRGQAATANGHGCAAVADGDTGGLGHTDDTGSQGHDERGHCADERTPWAASVAIPCADGKARRIEPGSFPLAHGIPGRVGLLRGYGNAIVPQVAAQFIQAFDECL